MVDLAKLVVRLEAENAKLTKALDKSTKDILRFEGTAKKAASSAKTALTGIFAGLGAGLAVRGLTNQVNSILDANDKIAKLSTTTGLLVEDLHALDLAATISGTNLDTVANGTKKLQKNMFDAVAGLKESKEGFEALDVEIQNTDGTLRDTKDVLLDIAERFQGMEDGAGKAALAQRLLGRAGTQLIPFLNQGREAISDYADEQTRLGNVLSKEVAQASERINDNFTRLSTASEGVSRSFTKGMLPALEDITTELVSASEGTNDASEELGRFAGNILRTGVSALLALKAGLDTVGNAIGRTAAVLVTAARGDFSAAWEIMNDESGSFIEEYSEAAESIKNIWSDVGANIAASAEGDSEKIAAPVILAADKAKKAAASIQKSVDDLAFDAIDSEFAAIDKQEAAKLAGTAGATPNQNAARELFEATRTPAEELANEIQRINTLYEDAESGLDEDTYTRAIFAAQDAFDELIEKTDETEDKLSVFAEQAARNMQDSFADFLFDPFAEDGLEGMLSGFSDTLRRMAAEAAAAEIFGAIGGSLGGTGGIGGAIGDFFTLAARANGGPLNAGQASIVGERGPEIFVPNQPGTVVSNSQAMGAITVNVTAPQSSGAQSAGQFGLEVAQALQLATGRNG